MQTTTVSHMGGEGAMWLGQQPFTRQSHVFANLGDGTYAHSGMLAVRQAVAADVPITYKILFNGFVSMTGGQPIEGGMTPIQILAELAAEGVKKMALVVDDPDRYLGVALPPGVALHHRDAMDEVQRDFREFKGVSVILYDQPCATERRRLRKRGKWADPAIRTFIHPEVCEGCGDCGRVSNCMAIEPLETEFGRKRRINQSSCNKDFSCVDGFCPSFVTVHGGRLRKVDVATPLGPYLPPVPEPTLPEIGARYSVLVAGIGGSGVVTVSQTLAVAAYLDGLFSSNLDLTGLSQKYGAVTSHVRIARNADALHATRIASGEADALIGCDLIVAAGDECASKLNPQTRAVISADLTPTADFARNPNWSVDAEALIERLKSALGDKLFVIDAQRLAKDLTGDAIASNMFMLGAAWQRGLLPLSRAAIDRAIELNGVAIEASKQAFEWGRRAAHDLAGVEALVAPDEPAPQPAPTLDALIERRSAHIRASRGEAEAKRYRALVERARRVEKDAGLGEALTAAVARAYHKLIAVKDEWEVARLFAAPEFQEALGREFEGDYKLHFHIGAWPFAKDRSVDRRDEEGRDRSVDADGVPGDGAAELPARHMARPVPQERRAPARAAAAGGVRGRRREAPDPAFAGDVRDRRPHCRPAGEHKGLRTGQGSERRRGGEGARGGVPAIAGAEDADGAGGVAEKRHVRGCFVMGPTMSHPFPDRQWPASSSIS